MMTPAESATLTLLLAHAQDLVPLRGWHPVAHLIENMMAVAADPDSDDAGISETDVRRLRHWARRWVSLHETVREFYERNVAAPGVPSALWCVLDHRPRPPGRTYGLLAQLWEEQHGYRCPYDLCPRIP